MAKNIIVYEGIIRLLYVDSFTLENDKLVTNIKNKVVGTELFYPKLLKFISLERDTILPTEEEAMFYLNQVISKRKDIIENVLTDSYFSEEKRKDYLDTISRISSCAYQEPDEVKPFCVMDKQDFKILKKKFKEKAKN